MIIGVTYINSFFHESNSYSFYDKSAVSNLMFLSYVPDYLFLYFIFHSISAVILCDSNTFFFHSKIYLLFFKKI